MIPRATSALPRRQRSAAMDAALPFQSDAQHLHALGPRAIAEFLAEIDRDLGAGPELRARLDAWRRITPCMVASALACSGGAQFPPRLSVVPAEASA